MVYKNIKKIIIGTLLCIYVVINPVITFAQVPSQDQFTGFSEAELEKQLEEEISKLSPEEQEQLFKGLEEFSQLPPEEQERQIKEAEKAYTELQEKVKEAIDQIGGEEALQKMSPEELDKFFEEFFSEQPLPGEKTEKVTEIKDEEKKIPAKKITDKQQKALDLIDAIIKQSNTFLVKVSSIPEFSEKVTSWIRKKKITYWDKDTSWDMVKGTIETLVQKLEVIRERDPKTKEYKYLEAFTANEVLNNNLAKIRSDLETSMTAIEVSVFGLKKVDKESNQALQNIVSSYGQAVKQLNIVEAINNVIATYEPTAKKLKEEEEQARKKAEAESKRKRPPARQVMAGQPEADVPYTPRPSGISPYDQYTPEPIIGASSSTYSPTRVPTSTKPTQETKPRGILPSGRALPKATPEKEGKDEKPVTGLRIPEDRKVTRAFEKIQTLLDTTINVLQDINTEFSDLPTYLQQPDDAAKDDSFVLKLNDALRKFTSPGDSILTGIKRAQDALKNASAEYKNKYKKELNTIIKYHETTLKTHADTIQAIHKNWATLKDKVTPEKRKRLLGNLDDGTIISTDSKKQQEREEKALLFTFEKAIRDVLHAVQNF